MASQGALQLTETHPSLDGRGQISRFISQLPLQMLHTQYEIHPGWGLSYKHVTTAATWEDRYLVF